jgi:hypothetical protein
VRRSAGCGTFYRPPSPSVASHRTCGVTGRRTRYVSSRKLRLLRPLLRYSFTVNAYVFRVGGRRRGPLFRTREEGGVAKAPPPDDLAPAEEPNDVPVSTPIPESATDAPPQTRPTLTIVRNHEAAHQLVQSGSKSMRPFSKSNQCPKCGFGEATIEYHDPDTGKKGCDPGEQIHRECLTCGYPWSDACLELTDHQSIASAGAGAAS